MTQTFARMPRGTQKKTLVWKKLYRDICEAHSSRKNCILILLFVAMLFLFALIIYVYESNLDRKGEYWCRYTFCIQLGHVVTCSWIHFQVKSHSIWYEPILTCMKMISISNKLFNTAFIVNDFVMLFFLHAGLMMKEQSSFECGACLLGFFLLCQRCFLQNGF